MSEELKVRKGTKILEEEAKGLDRSKMGIATATPPTEEVQAQYEYLAAVSCPWCGHIAWATVDTDHYHWFTCGWCGRPFKA